MPPDVVALTQQLVRIPSINPMGRHVSGPEYLEGRVGDFLADLFTQWNLSWERHAVLPGRDNLIARLPRGSNDLTDSLLLEVHQDTVPIDGMSIDPFAGELRDGRIYGRGACDVKGGMAAMLCAIAQLQERPGPNQPEIILACTVNEENGFDGVRHLCRHWQDGTSELLCRPPRWAIVAEPTELEVVVAHKGTVRWRCHARGRAAHSSNPAAGCNAIYRMQPVISALQRYAEEILPSVATSHPLLGGPTLSVGTIRGGLSVNTVPDQCTIEIDRRLLPGESADEAFAAVRAHVAQSAPVEGIEHEPPFLAAPGLASVDNQELAAALSQSARRSGTGARHLGVPFGTDAGTLAAAGIPTVVFGPGSIQQAHTKDEWIDVEQLRRAVAILGDFCRNPTQRP